MTYEEAQQERSSVKILLAKVNASIRLMGFTLDSGSIYKLTNFDFPVINSIEDLGVGLTEVASKAAITEGKFFNDKNNKEFFVHVTGSGNPNGSFLVNSFINFFSNLGISFPIDPGVGSGIDVYWRPLVKSVSKFGVELDNEDQIGLAIEGSGKITFHNDRSYWDSRYEKFNWNEQDVEIFNTFEGLAPSEAKLLYKGKINRRDFSGSTVNFTLKDLVSQIRTEFPLTDLSALVSDRIPNDLLNAKQRRLYGRLFGHKLLSIDQVLDGFPLTGTASATAGSDTITGAGSTYLKEVSPEDILIINEIEVTVEDVTGDSTIILTEDFTGTGGSGLAIKILPTISKKYINRKFLIAGHAVKEPKTTVLAANALNQIRVDDITDFKPDDEIFVGALGSGERVFIDQIFTSINTLKLKQSLAFPPPPGTEVLRFTAQNVRLNGSKLLFDRDYSVDAAAGTLTLKEVAEFNVAPVRLLNGTVIMTSGLRTVTGVDTAFESQLKPGDYIRVKGNFDFFEILAIDSDVALRLRTVSSFTDSGTGQYKPVNNFDENIDTLSADVLGGTVEGTKTGEFFDSASPIVKDILKQVGLTNINITSFDKSRDIAEHQIGLAIPTEFDQVDSPKTRDIINQINFSVLGSLVQNEDFEFEYNILNPTVQSATTFREFDVLTFAVSTDNERIVKTAIVTYLEKEFDFEALNKSFRTQQKTSNIGNHLVKTTRTKTIKTLLVQQESARIFSTRWAFLLELGSSVIRMQTKMQGSRLQVNDVIDLFHEKLFERVGGGKRKLSAIQKIVKNHQDVDIETEDLSNTFNRTGMITENDAPNFDNSSDEQKFFNGFITDNFGLINNDAETFDLNLIW